jgi:hypothetical protein
MKMKLQRLGLRYGTDKHRHRFNGVNYMHVYNRYFQPMREQVLSVLELGVLDGGSLKVWRDYFPLAHIWGVDINPEAQRDHGERIHIMIGSQTDPAVLPAGPFQIVIDDGSHVVDHMIASFNLLWPRVTSGGLYIIEDLENIYADISKSKNLWPGQSHNAVDTNYLNDAAKLNNLFAAKLKDLDQGKGDLLYLHRWHQQAIFCKA